MKISKSFRKIFLLSFALFLCVMICTSTVYSSQDNSVTTRLSNGMEVVMIENHSAPLISVFVVIRSGSATETYRQNGITHLLEHMLFNGTETRSQQEIYDEMDLIGGYNNAYTRKDYTAFIITIPTRNIEKGMDIQSDMLFHSIFDPDKTKKELGIITEEIRRDTSNPNYSVDANFDAWLYDGTPYEKTIMGTIEGVQKLGADEIKKYWSQFYAPNNMKMIVMGDFKPTEMIKLVEKYYGKAQPSDLLDEFSGKPKHIEKTEIKIDFIPDVQRTIKVALDAVSPIDRDGMAYKLMVEMISDEINAYLKDHNPSDPLQVYCEKSDTLKGSHLIMTGNIPDSISDDDALSMIIEALNVSGGKKTSEDKLEIARISAIASEIKMRENSMYFGMFTVGDMALWGWDYVRNKEKMLSDVTVKQIDSLRENYLISPKVKVYIAKPLSNETSHDENNLENWRSETLPNGLQIAIKQDNSSEVFGLHILVKNRCYMEPGGMDGIVDLLHRTLTSGTVDMTGDEISNTMSSLGIDIKTNDISFLPFDDYYLSPEYSYIRVTGLDRFWKDNIELVAHLIQNDGITEEILSSERANVIRSLVPQAMMTSTKAKKVFKEQLLGDSPLTRSITGNAGTLNKITIREIKEFRKNYFSSNNLILTIVTSEDPDDVIRTVKDNFGSMKKVSASVTVPEVKLKMNHEPEYVTEMGGKQSYIIYSWTIESVPDDDKIPLLVLGEIINKEVAFELREKQGLAYSIGASFKPEGKGAYFYLAMGTGPENIDTAKTGIKSVLENMKTKQLTQRDVDLAVNSTAAQMIRYRVKRENQAYYMGYNIFRGKDVKYSPVDEWYAVKLEDIIRVRNKYMSFENGFYVIAK